MNVKRIAVVSTALVVALLSVAPAHADETYTLKDKKAEALAKKEPLLIKFGAEWCGPCKRFSADAASNADLQKMLGPVVLCELDGEKGEGIELAKTYEVIGYPTFIVLNSDDQVLDRWIGYGAPADFGKALTASLADPTPLDARMEAFKTSPTGALAARLAHSSESRGDNKAAAEYYTAAKKLDPAGAGEYNQGLFMAQVAGLRDKSVTVDQVKRTADEIVGAKDAKASDMAIVAMEMTGLSRREEKPELAVPYLTAAHEAGKNATDPETVDMMKSLAIDYTVIVEKDLPKATELMRASMPEGWMDSPDQLNSFAWWCFENKTNLDEALTLARKGAEIAKTGKEKAMILDTAAEICLAKGGCKDAVDLEEEALKNAPDSKYYKKQLERFQKELAMTLAPDNKK